jgi:hypothetical protein
MVQVILKNIRMKTIGLYFSVFNNFSYSSRREKVGNPTPSAFSLPLSALSL